MKAKNLNRENEKGAALVMALLMAALLLTGCIALLAGASLLTANVTDAVAEQQAYNAAESGVQTAINVMRRNTVPSPLIDPSKPANHTDNKIDFGRAVNLETSNLPTDTATEARLSRWINYTSTSPGATSPDRAVMSDGSSFSVTVRDPDNPNAIIALTTSADIGNTGNSSKTYLGLPFNSTTIQYNSSTTNTNVTARSANISLGSFTVSRYGIGDTPITKTPFTITVKMTAPFPALIKLRGEITDGSIGSNSVSGVKINFDSPVYNLLGSIITLPASGLTPNAPSPTTATTNLGVTITLSQPRRLVIRSDGYGPRGAHKVFEAIVTRDNFDGIVPATVTLVGAATNSIFKSNSLPVGALVKPISYSGSDPSNNALIPPVATITGGSGGGLLTGVLTNLTGTLCVGCDTTGKSADIATDETPDYLKSAANLDSLISRYRETAKASGRYFSNGNSPNANDFGNSFDGTGITFVEGDSVLNGNGGGLLIVTGRLTLGSAFNFKGTILATGKDGVKKADSTGNSTLTGNLVVAPYQIGNTAAGFLPPKYDISGGAVPRIAYTASNLLFGSDNYNTVVISVGEK